MLGIVASCAIVTVVTVVSSLSFKTRRFSDIRLQQMSWTWNRGQRSLKVSGAIR